MDEFCLSAAIRGKPNGLPRPNRITTDTDMTAGLTSGNRHRFSRGLSGALRRARVKLGRRRAHRAKRRASPSRCRFARGGALSKELLTQHGEPGQAVKLFTTRWRKSECDGMKRLPIWTQAQHLPSTLTPSLKPRALAAE